MRTPETESGSIPVLQAPKAVNNLRNLGNP